MANESVPVEGEGRTVDHTISGEATKGQSMFLSDLRTCSGASLSGQIFAGIVGADSTGGAKEVGLHQKGIWDMRVFDPIAVTAGMKMTMSGANTLVQAKGQGYLSGGVIVGTILENVAAATAEIAEVDIGRKA